MENSSQNRKFTPLIRLALSFALYGLLNILLMAIVLIFLGQEPSTFTTNIVRALFGLVGTGAYLLLTKKIDRRDPSVLSLGLNSQALKAFIFSLVLAGITVGLGAYISNHFFFDQMLYLDERTWADLPTALIAGFLLQGLPEEVVFRAYLPQTLEKDPWPTFALTSLAFMIFHWQYLFMPPFEALANLAYPLAFGALAFVLRYLSGSTWAAVAVHGGIHVFRNILSIYGFHDGPLRALITAIIMTILVMLILIWKKDEFRPENNRIPNS